jgi:hypothetical protein
MMNLEDAKSIALQLIRKSYDLSSIGDTIEIVDAKTRELPKGWVFFYNSARFLRTGDFDSMLMGNKPVFVHRETGEALRMEGTLEEAVHALLSKWDSLAPKN